MPLEDAVKLDLYARYPLLSARENNAEIYFTVRNVLDAPLFFQSGLPAPGRALETGLRLRL